MTHDVTAGPSSLIVTTDRGAAERIAAAIEAERPHLFQMEGLPIAVKDTDRDKGAKKDDEPSEGSPDTIGRKARK